MPSLCYHAPETVQQAVSLTTPSAVIDLKRIAGLNGVRAHQGGFAIGAATACTALKEHKALMAAWPGVVEAANLIGSVQVRNRATMAGNLCNASPAADSVPALIAAGASCLIAGPSGQREVAVEAIPVSPGHTSLAPGEFVVEIYLPARPVGGGDAYLRSIPRTEMDIAVAGAGAALVIGPDGICTAARIALGAIAPTALLVSAAAQALVGTKLDEVTLQRMAEAVRAACRPIDDKRGTIAYRIAMAGVLAKRVVAIARMRAGEAA